MSDDLFGGETPGIPQPRKPVQARPGQPAAQVREINPETQPLADKLRPRTFEGFLGQDNLVGDGAPLRQLIESDRVHSMIFWGPPGSGKTTLASIIARATNSDFVTMSAVTSGVKDVRQVIEVAKLNRQYVRRTILFVDEIHRFNKAQQDAFLPHVESGLITLMGATTENPSFSINSALLSRCRVFHLQPLSEETLKQLLQFGIQELNKLKPNEAVELPNDAADAIVQLSDGDARRALGLLEIAVDVARSGGTTQAGSLSREAILDVAQRHLLYDRAGEEHYNVISALHKTIRSSDPHAAVYWCERMLAGGEDPRFILRRLVRAAAEDIGLADPHALPHAVACLSAFEKIGQPEGNIFVTQLAVYLATAPKSDAVYKAAKKAAVIVQETGTLAVPMHLRNAPTQLMKKEGYSDGYTYDHDSPDHFIAKQGLPDELHGTRIYEPTELGAEKQISERLQRWDEERKKIQQ